MQIFEDVPDLAHQVIGPVKARVTSKTVFSKERTVGEVYEKLADEAAQLGANGVIGVQYSRGISATSWKALTATGVAVVFGTLPPPQPVPPQDS